MLNYRKGLISIAALIALMNPMVVFASQANNRDEEGKVQQTVVKPDTALPEVPEESFKDNPLFKSPRTKTPDDEADLTQAGSDWAVDDWSDISEEELFPRKKRGIDQISSDGVSAKDVKMVEELEGRLRKISDDLDNLINKANDVLNDAPQDPLIFSYWKQIQKFKNVPQAYERAMRELDALQKVHKQSNDAADIRKYLDWMCRIPWNLSDKVSIDLTRASAALDRDHAGLDKIKERIIEELAVRKRMPQGNQAILCFVGPPGVGKTTLGKAIAEAMGRKFVRIPLGGINDEAQIRGFLRTYSSSLPGQLTKALAEIGVNNPVMLLDEIDKMKESNHGDPAAALLEVLDSHQNNAFLDHYLEVPLDLSNIVFIATANSYNIPGPLRDRMEIIELSSYTVNEKLEIAKKHLVPNALNEKGLKMGEVSFTDLALRKVITEYTAEAGVRDLNRCLGALCRKVVLNLEQGHASNIIFDPQKIQDYLGKPRVRPTKAFTKDTVGSTQGLAWTSVGGTLLPIEVMTVPGSGDVIATGNLGDVMKESVTAAKVVMKSLLSAYKIDPESLKKIDIHIHAPEAAVKKDGPSAGVTITTSLISALTGIPVSKNVAMTGEINLKGEVMAIGGLKEKLIAAHTAGLTRVMIPKDNAIDLDDVPAEVKQGLEILPVDHIRDVLKYALVKEE